MEPWSFTTLLVTFGGGIAGAAFGGLWAIILCGFMVLGGCIVVMAGGSDFMLLQVGLGPVFGPHVGGFASGIAAACYAVGVKKNHPSGSAKDILSPLVDTSWDVLIVGGLFAVFGHILIQVLGKIPVINQFDVMALDVVITNILARLIFIKEMPWGRADSIKEHGYMGTANYSISWAGWQSPPPRMIAQSLGLCILSGALAMGLKGQLAPLAAAGKISGAGAFVVPLIMGWAIAIINLVALMCANGALQKIPIFHCPALMTALAYLSCGSLVMAVIVGILAAFLQELVARMFYNHGSSHIDPPATAAAIGTFMINMAFKPEFLNLGQFFN